MQKLKIRSISLLKEKRRVYDLSVPFNHNFFIGDQLVLTHNCDYLSHNAQGTLRQMMEDFHENARFIFTLNNFNKIIPALKSRCQIFEIKKHSLDQITTLTRRILDSESVSYDDDVLGRYIGAAYPDIRRTINLIQQNVSSGKLQSYTVDGEGGDTKLKILELLEEGSLGELRKFACENISTNEWEEFYRLLYDNIHKCFTDQTMWESAIIIIAEHLYKNTLVSDEEINFSACMIKLKQLQKRGSNNALPRS